jgi:outer membrane biosynthesis protein TonB
MISRTLVPRDVKPPKPEDLHRSASRVTTYMDDRMVVPAGPSDAPPLDGKTNIPAHMPLGVLVDTTLVPRGMPVKPLERTQVSQEQGAMALEVLDARTVVPAHIKPLTPEERQESVRPLGVTRELREVIEPDIFTTGDANLLIEPAEKHDSKWDNLARIGSIIAHIALVLFLINIPRIFSNTEPTAEDIALAQKELPFVYLPPTTPTPRPPTPKMPKLDPKMLEKMAPPVEKPLLPEPAPPLPQPAKPAPELPEAPTPHNLTPTPQPPPPQQAQQPQPSQLEPIKPQPNHLNLQLPTSSPGELLRQQEEDAIKRQNQGGSYSTGGRLPGGAGAQGPSANAQVRTLSPTEGVDFNSYIQRMLDTIQRNWYAIMPQSAMLGDKGIVYVTYTINPDGSIQAEDPELQRTSQKEPLDKAAMASIRASNPFEPLPKEFHGPSMKFGIIFLYNVPLESLNH